MCPANRAPSENVILALRWSTRQPQFIQWALDCQATFRRGTIDVVFDLAAVLDPESRLRDAVVCEQTLLKVFLSHFRCVADETVSSDHVQPVIALNNPVVNSFDSLTNTENSRILMQVETGARFVQVSVDDNGYGLPDDMAPRAFNAFFSIKPHRGKGLGLSTTRRTIEMGGGSLHVCLEQGKGLCFDIRPRPNIQVLVPQKVLA